MNATISVVNDECGNNTVHFSQDTESRADKLRQVRVHRHVRVPAGVVNNSRDWHKNEHVVGDGYACNSNLFVKCSQTCSFIIFLSIIIGISMSEN